MMKMLLGFFAAAVVCTAAAGDQGGGDEDGGGAVELPHAGISLTLPEGFARHAPQWPAVLYAIRGAGRKNPRSATLSVMPAGEDATLVSGLDSIVEGLRRNLAFRHVRVLKCVDTKVVELAGKVALLSYTHRGDETTAVLTVFLRELPDKKGRIFYALSVETLAADQEALLPTYKEIITSVRLADISSPSEMAAPKAGEPIEDVKLGYSIRVPQDWSIVRRYEGIELAQADYSAGGRLAFRAAVRVAKVAADVSPEALLKKSVEAKEGQGAGGKVLASGPASLGGLSGHQILVRMAGRDADTTTAPASRPAGVLREAFIVHRAACGPGPEPDSRILYSLILLCAGADAEKAAAVMDTLASGFSVTRTGKPAAETRPAEKQ